MGYKIITMRTIVILFKSVFTTLKKIFSSKFRTGVVILVLITAGYFGYQNFWPKTAEVSYQTSPVEKGTLVRTVSASGNVTSGSSVNITTGATGVATTVYVKPGDQVTKGQKIAELTLDQDSEQKQASAWASYLSAINSVKTAEHNKLSADATMWQAQQSVWDNLQTVQNKNESDPNPATKSDYTQMEEEGVESGLIQARKSFTASEQMYKDADSAINSAKAQLTSAWYEYQQLASVITASSDGTISNLTISEGYPISSQANSSDSAANQTQSIGTITLPQGQVQASVNLSEIDVTKISPGQKTTITLDAFPDKTFTGKVLNIDTSGSVSSGVTTYPATISLDTALTNIYPNMAVNAEIITEVKDHVVIVPSSAVQNSNGQSTIRVMKNGVVQNVNVETGTSNDTQTEIISGISEGDEIVTSSSASTIGTQNQTTSPFSRSFGGTGGAVRIGR